MQCFTRFYIAFKITTLHILNELAVYSKSSVVKGPIATTRQDHEATPTHFS